MGVRCQIWPRAEFEQLVCQPCGWVRCCVLGVVSGDQLLHVCRLYGFSCLCACSWMGAVLRVWGAEMMREFNCSAFSL